MTPLGIMKMLHSLFPGEGFGACEKPSAFSTPLSPPCSCNGHPFVSPGLGLLAQPAADSAGNHRDVSLGSDGGLEQRCARSVEGGALQPRRARPRRCTATMVLEAWIAAGNRVEEKKAMDESKLFDMAERIARATKGREVFMHALHYHPARARVVLPTPLRGLHSGCLAPRRSNAPPPPTPQLWRRPPHSEACSAAPMTAFRPVHVAQPQAVLNSWTSGFEAQHASATPDPGKRTSRLPSAYRSIGRPLACMSC